MNNNIPPRICIISSFDCACYDSIAIYFTEFVAQVIILKLKAMRYFDSLLPQTCMYFEDSVRTQLFNYYYL